MQIGFSFNSIFPQRICVAIWRMHIVNRKPDLPGQLRLAMLFSSILIAPPERSCAKSGLLDALQTLFDGQGVAEPGEYPELSHVILPLLIHMYFCFGLLLRICLFYDIFFGFAIRSGANEPESQWNMLAQACK